MSRRGPRHILGISAFYRGELHRTVLNPNEGGMAMDDGTPAPEKAQSAFERVEDQNGSLLRELVGFLGKNKKWWLLPILGTFLVVGMLVLLSTTAAAPFIYTFF
jgi:hypothetical protein